MRKKNFDDLVTSIREAGRVRRGEAEPSRVTEFPPVDVKAVRLNLMSDHAVRQAFTEIMTRGHTLAAGDNIEGVLIQAMIWLGLAEGVVPEGHPTIAWRFVPA